MPGFEMIGAGMIGAADASDAPSSEIGSSAHGAATVTMGMGAAHPVAAVAHGVATVTETLGKPVRITTVSAGAGGVLRNDLRLVDTAGNFTIYQSHGPYNASDVLLAPSAGPSGAQGFQGTSSGAAGGSWTLGRTQHLNTQSNGVAHTSAREGTAFGVSLTANGIGAFTNYFGSPARMTATSRGVAGATLYLSGSLYLSATTAAGVAHVTNDLAGPAPLFARTSLATGAGGTWSMAGPVPLRATAHGVATASLFQYQPPTLTMTSRGVAYFTINATIIPGPYVQSTSNGVANVIVNPVGRVYISSFAHGVGNMYDTPPPKFQCHAGCNAFSEPEPIFGVTNQYAIFNQFIYHAQVSGPYVNAPGGGRRYGVFAYLSSPAGLDNNQDFVSDVGTTKMAGRASASLYQPGELRMVVTAGCRAFPSYRSDEDPRYFRNPWQGPYDPPVQGVKIYQTGRTYFTSIVNTYLDPPRNGHGIDIWSMASDHNRLRTTSNGVASVDVTERFADRTYFNGVATFTRNALNVPSNNLQSFASHGVASAFMYGAGRTELTTTSNGVGGAFSNYLSSPVYLRTTSHGVAGPNRIDAYGYNQALFVRAGCYPYTVPNRVDPDTGEFILGGTHPGVEIAMDRPTPKFSVRMHGVSSMTAEIQGVPVFNLLAHGRAGGTWRLKDFLKKAESFSNGVGHMSATAFQAHDWQSNGVGGMRFNVNFFTLLSWQNAFDGGLFRPDYPLEPNKGTRAGGVATVFWAPPPVFESHTVPNGFSWNAGTYVPDGTHLVYTPDAWRMNATWALHSRTRGRSRVDITMYMRSVYGNLLARYWSTQRPDEPDIDGQPNTGYGQYWPRALKLPWNEPRTPYPYWYDYEYARR